MLKKINSLHPDSPCAYNYIVHLHLQSFCAPAKIQNLKTELKKSKWFGAIRLPPTPALPQFVWSIIPLFANDQPNDKNGEYKDSSGLSTFGKDESDKIEKSDVDRAQKYQHLPLLYALAIFLNIPPQSAHSIWWGVQIGSIHAN